MRSSSVKKIALALVVGIFCLNALLPFGWIMLNAFKGEKEFYASSSTRHLLPAEPTLDNFRQVLRSDGDLPAFFRNSLVVALGTVVATLLIVIFAAYAIARFEFPGRDLCYYLFLISMLFPGEAVLVSLYEMLFKLHLLNTIPGLILPTTAAAIPMALFLLRDIFENIPRDLEDAAMIDGCGRLRILWHVVLPNSMAGLSSVALLTFLAAWNDFGLPLVLTKDDQAMTIAAGVARLQDQFGNYELNVLCAAILLVFVPIGLLFLVAQRSFVRGLMGGAVKG
ncbi:carbohydrate ABC transporter permease [soil metagenome]